MDMYRRDNVVQDNPLLNQHNNVERNIHELNQISYVTYDHQTYYRNLYSSFPPSRQQCTVVYSVLHSQTAESSSILPMPVAAPNFTSIMTGSSTERLFMVDITQAMPAGPTSSSDSGTNQPSAHNVSYLFKIQMNDSIHYLWQVVTCTLYYGSCMCI